MSVVSNWFAAVNALSGQLDGASIKYPSEALATIDPSAFALLCKEYSANQTRRLALAETLAGTMEKVAAVTVGDVVGVGVRGVGYAETVVSGVASKMRDLYVDGKPYAEVAAACVAEPVQCVERGKWWKKNKARKLREKNKKKNAAASGGESEVSGTPRSSLQESLDRKREVENMVAERKARAELELLSDPVLVEMAREAAKKKLVGQTAVAACRAAKSLSELEAVSPGSSASQFEVREFREQLRERDRLILELETSLREVDEAEARRIMQGSVRKGLFSCGDRVAGRAGPGETFVNADGETVTACIICGEDCTCDMSDME